MIETIREAGGDILAVYHCPHQTSDGCSCRKPEPGLLFRAADDYGIELSETFFIGDAPRDMEAGRSAGTRTIFIENEMNAGSSIQPQSDFRVTNLSDAVEIVVKETGKTS